MPCTLILCAAFFKQTRCAHKAASVSAHLEEDAQALRDYLMHTIRGHLPFVGC